ncbi:MAG: hypothetical protein R3Y33_07295 [Clostridia bacterium]
MFNKIKSTAKKITNKARGVMDSVKAMSQTTEIVLLIVLVVAVIGAFFAPQITSWFEGVMGDLATHTDDLFAYAPTI